MGKHQDIYMILGLKNSIIFYYNDLKLDKFLFVDKSKIFYFH